MGYKHDMSGEKDPNILLPEGWREFEIIDCKEETSKQNNPMFVFTVADVETALVDDIYAIAVKGKRWFLKQILMACGIEAGKDGIYEWDINNVLTQNFLGKVEHFNETWVDRDNKTRTTPKWKIMQIKALDSK